MPESQRVISPGRTLIVLIGLIAVGMIIGSACALAMLPILIGGIPTLGDLQGPIPFVIASVGALFGAFLAPIAGFSLLRHVPLGRAILWTAVGTVIGGVVGIAEGGLGVTMGPLTGFGLAAFRLWVETTEAHRRRIRGSNEGRRNRPLEEARRWPACEREARVTIGGEARQAFEGIEGTRCDEKTGTGEV
jgi:hypothetical protein